jgi:hypothetical protein
MRTSFLIALTCPTLLLACSSNGPASGFIDVGNLAGMQFLYIQIVYPGAPTSGTAESEFQGKPVTVGACTYFPPLAPVGLPTYGSGTPNTAANAGTIAIVDTTSHGTLGTFSNSSDGYTPLSGVSPSVPWHSGDTVTVTAAGDAVGAFSMSVRTLSTPSVTFPSPSSAAHDLTVTWVPDSNAQLMTIGISNSTRGTSVSCKLSDSLGTLTIDSSLLASFGGDLLTSSAERETDETVQDGSTSMVLRSFARSTASIALN